MRVDLAGRRPLLHRQVHVSPSPEGSLVLDAQRLLFASPLDLTAVVALAHTAAAKQARVTFVMPADVNVASYLQRMDVFRRLPPCTQIHGSPPPDQRTDRSQTLLEVSPLSPVTVEDLAARLGRLATGHFGNGIARIVFRGIGELVDNAVSHGHSRLGAFLSAQTYTGRTTGQPGYEFAICDTGIGVLAHLRRNPEHRQVPDAQTALACALQPGVTGTTEQRGYGLPDLLKITSDGGEGRLVLRSGDAIASVVLRRQHRRDAYTTANLHVPGTWAWLRVQFP